MSADWVSDIKKMHEHYRVHEVVRSFDEEKLHAFLEFRLNFLEEEFTEALFAKNADDLVDAFIDLAVISIGTLDLLGVNSYTAWDRVLEANMNKEVGIKESRPNKLGLPDLIKPEGWTAPSHKDNIGLLSKVFKNEAN